MSETETLTEADYATHDEYLRSLASRLLTGSHGGVAEDAVHDTWLRFLRRPPALDRPLRPWLTKVLRNRSLELRRSAGRRGALEARMQRVSLAPAAVESAARHEAAERLHRAVHALREPYRTTIQLHFQEGLSPAEVGERLGVPEATVRSRIRRALVLLREELEGRSGGGREDWLGGLVLLARGEARSAPRTVGLVLGAVLVVGTGAVLWTRLAGVESREALASAPLVQAVRGEERIDQAVGQGGRVPVATPTSMVSLRVRVRRAFSKDPVAGVVTVATRGDTELARGRSDAKGGLALPLPSGPDLSIAFEPTSSTDGLRVELDSDWAERPVLEVELPAVCDVRGSVEWSPGSPAGGVEVRAIRGSFPYFLDGAPLRPLHATRTRPDGSFRLERVPIDAALLATDEGGKRYGLYGPPRRSRAEDGPLWDEWTVRGEEDYLDAARPVLIRLAVADLLSVLVLGPDGNPVEGAELLLKGSAYTLRRKRSGADGRAIFQPLSNGGEHVLAARSPGLAEWAHGPFVFDRERSEWVVRLAEQRTVRGSVVDRDGRPLPGVRVLATMLEPSPSPFGTEALDELPLGFQAPREAVSDDRGRFTVEGLGSGEYELEAFRGETRLVGIRARGGDEGVVLGEGSAPSLLRFHGTVLDAQDGSRVSGALVVLERSRGAKDERFSQRGGRLSGADFSFSVDDPGRWVLHVVAEGYAPYSSAPRTFGPGSHLLEPELYRARDVVLRLEDARGRPLTDAWVMLLGQPATAPADLFTASHAGAVEATDANGVARLKDAPSAACAVQVFAPYFMRTFSFVVPEGSAGSESVVTLVVEADCTTPRQVQPWIVVDARTGREPTTEELDPAELDVWDEAGTRVLNLLWIEPTPEQKASERGRVRVPFEAGGSVSVRELTPPGPWWWFGPGPLFSRDGEPCLPSMLLAPGRYRIHLTARGFEPLERWIEVGEAVSPAVPLRLVMTPAGGD